MTFSANVFLIDNPPISNEYSIQISEEKKVGQVKPAGAWFTEEEELP